MSFSGHYDSARAALVDNPNRRDKDFYKTPDDATQKILPIVTAEYGNCYDVVTATDPFCGDGAILDSIKKFDPRIETFGIELDPQRFTQAVEKHPNVIFADAFTRGSEWKRDKRTSLLITNPPFNCAPDAIILATNLGIDRVVFLVRVALLLNKSLRDILLVKEPDVYILDKVTFEGFDNPFPEMMMWLYFHPGSNGKWAIL